MDVPEKLRLMTKSYMRVGDLVRDYSDGARLVIVSLPVPRHGCESAVYMSWVDIMSQCTPPVMLVRGNQEDVLTFYS